MKRKRARAGLPIGEVMLAGVRFSDVPGIALAFAAIGYLISVLRDWRPIKALREENRELRASLELQAKRYGELERRNTELERRCSELEKSRDFTSALEPLARAIDQEREAASHEHEKILASLEELAKGLATQTGAIGALAASLAAAATVAEGS